MDTLINSVDYFIVSDSNENSLMVLPAAPRISLPGFELFQINFDT